MAFRSQQTSTVCRNTDRVTYVAAIGIWGQEQTSANSTKVQKTESVGLFQRIKQFFPSEPANEKMTITDTLCRTVPIAGYAAAFGRYDEIARLKNVGQKCKALKVQDKCTGAVRCIQARAKKDGKNDLTPIIKKEVDVLSSMNHPNVVTLHAVLEDRDFSHLVTEFCQGGDFLDEYCVKHYNVTTEGSSVQIVELEIAKLMMQVLRGLKYCHSKHIVHNDICPPNLLLSEDKQHATIINFKNCFSELDACSVSQTSQFATGRPEYAAPEIYREGVKDITAKVDIWSLGITLFHLLTGKTPAVTRDVLRRSMSEAMLCSIKDDLVNHSKEVSDLLANMLTTNTTARFTADQCLKHDWFKMVPAEEVDPERKIQMCDALKRITLNTEHPIRTFLKNVVAQQANVSSAKMQDAMIMFQEIDIEGDGELNKSELEAYFTGKGDSAVCDSSDTDEWDSYDEDDDVAEVVGSKWTCEEVDSLISALDARGNGVVTYTEFIAAVVQWDPKAGADCDALLAAFGSIDFDGDASITQKELLKLINNGNKATIKKFMQEIDSDGDKKIGYAEFLEIVGAKIPDAE